MDGSVPFKSPCLQTVGSTGMIICTGLPLHKHRHTHTNNKDVGHQHTIGRQNIRDCPRGNQTTPRQCCTTDVTHDLQQYHKPVSESSPQPSTTGGCDSAGPGAPTPPPPPAPGGLRPTVSGLRRPWAPNGPRAPKPHVFIYSALGAPDRATRGAIEGCSPAAPPFAPVCRGAPKAIWIGPTQTPAPSPLLEPPLPPPIWPPANG